MRRNPPFHTPTMARLYAGQGYLRKAAEIYRSLILVEPERKDLVRELTAIEEQIKRQSHPARKELGLMMREWAQLIEKQREFNRKGSIKKGGDDGNEDDTR